MSQRGLAAELRVSQSSGWLGGRPAARFHRLRYLEAVLALSGVTIMAVDEQGETVDPMNEVAVRDRADRRYPAHATPEASRLVGSARLADHGGRVQPPGGAPGMPGVPQVFVRPAAAAGRSCGTCLRRADRPSDAGRVVAAMEREP